MLFLYIYSNTVIILGAVFIYETSRRPSLMLFLYNVSTYHVEAYDPFIPAVY